MKRRHSGFGIPPLVLAGLLLAQLVSAAPLPNAWQITDSLATSGALNYATNLFVRRSSQRHQLAGQPQRLVGGAGDWGTGSGTGQGRMNFHSATFAVTNSIVASYDAGPHGNPAVAPSPMTQGWTETARARTSIGGEPLQVHDV